MTIPNKFNNGELADAPLVNENFDYLDTLTEDIAKNVKLLSDTSTFTKYDETKTYAKDDIVTVLSPDGRIVAYISLKNQNNGNALSDENWWKKTDLGGGNMPVGTIFAHSASATFVPENSLPCNGSEYTKQQFNSLWVNWLTNGNLETCTYEQYQQDIANNGACAKFGLDTVSGKFKVPNIPDGYYVRAGKGTANKAGLPNLKGDLYHWIDSKDGTGVFKTTQRGSGFTFSGNWGSSEYEATTNFDASRSNPVYGKSSTVETNAVAYRYFVVVATGSIKQSEMDWSQWASSLQGKANIDLSNCTKPYIIESYHSGHSGYNVYSNKYCEQWGKFTVPSTGKGALVFFKPWASKTSYSIVVTGQTGPREAVANYYSIVGDENWGDSGITILNSGKFASGVHWQAKGYIK